ncbi:MAG: PleD family two-component system response regulator [Anaerolineales bacterium]|jgi:CheY-like chemotaxis protein
MSKILIVDDDPHFGDAAQILMEHDGHQVERAFSGKEGLQKAVDNRPDLVILDVMMETVLEGVTLTKKLHQNPRTTDIPVLMVSSIANSDYAGLFPTDEYIYIDAFLTKPVDPVRMVRKVHRILA